MTARKSPRDKPRRSAESAKAVLADEIKIAEAFVANPKATTREIGKAVGVSAATVSYALRRRRVKAHIAKLTKPARRKLEITAERVLQGLAELAFSNIGDYVDITDDGLAQVNLKKADVVALGAISEITSETVPSGMQDEDGSPIVVTKTKLKLASKREALETLARVLKIIGHEEEAQLPSVQVVINHVAPEEHRRVGQYAVIDQESR